MTTQVPATAVGAARRRVAGGVPMRTNAPLPGVADSSPAFAGAVDSAPPLAPTPVTNAGWTRVVTGTAVLVAMLAVASVFTWLAGTDATASGAGAAIAALTGAAAAGLCLVAGRATGRDDLRSAWALVALAFAAWATSTDLAWVARSGSEGASLVTAVARLSYFAFFPLATIGILRLSGHRRAEPPHTLVFDAVSVCIAVVAALYILVAPWGARPALLVPEVAFRAGDAVIVAALALTALRWPHGAPRGPMIVLGTGFGLLLVADLAGSLPGGAAALPIGPAAAALAALGMASGALGAAWQVRSGPIPEAERRGDGRSHSLVPLVPGVAVTVALAALLATRPELLDAPIMVLLIGATTLTVVAGLRRALGQADAGAAGAQGRSGRWDPDAHALAGPTPDIIVTVDRSGRVVSASPGLARLTEYAAEATIGAPFLDRVATADRKRVAWELGGEGRVDHPGSRTLEFRMLRRDFTPVDVEAALVDLGDDPTNGGTVLTIRDVAERHLYESDLRRQAFHDQLTGLANRAHFFDRVEHALERCFQSGDRISILYMDLDGFKRINDSLGHAVGDRVLGIVGERLSWCVRGGDMVARLGGDEFAVLLEEAGMPTTAMVIAERIQQAVATPILVGGRQVRVGVSIGIASSGTLDETAVALAGDPLAVTALADELVRNADVAMYESKHGGKERIAAYQPAMRLATVVRLDTETALREAVDERQFVVHYQPIVDLSTGRIVGMEALARWRRPGVGLVSPSHFIAIAEETGLVRAMGAQLLRTACQTAARWSNDGPFDLAVNLSPRQISDPLLVGLVERALAETGLDPRRLVFEITESLLLDDGALTLERLGQLRAMGIRLAIDDFGTGYSSLSYLGQLPVDILKIDRSFVVDLATSPKRATLLRAIVAMAGALGLTTVAEGVETPEQLMLVRELGCHNAQGFLLAGPAGAEEATAIIARDAAVGGTFSDLMQAIDVRLARARGDGRTSARRARSDAQGTGTPSPWGDAAGPSYRPERTEVAQPRT